ncbi:MAG: response regulator, partial [Burkholderiaceae bacterium]
QALKLFEREKPGVVVSDIGMPDMDGFELMRRIQVMTAESGEVVPVIALTAFARSDDKKRAMEAGFTAYMAKPLEPAELIANIAAFAQFGSRQNKNAS